MSYVSLSWKRVTAKHSCPASASKASWKTSSGHTPAKKAAATLAGSRPRRVFNKSNAVAQTASKNKMKRPNGCEVLSNLASQYRKDLIRCPRIGQFTTLAQCFENVCEMSGLFCTVCKMLPLFWMYFCSKPANIGSANQGRDVKRRLACALSRIINSMFGNTAASP